MSRDNEDFIRWSFKRGSWKDRLYWIIAYVIVGLIIAAVIGLIVLRYWVRGSPLPI